jgi:hypothetical protein
MPTHVKPEQKPKIASFARMLAHITFGFGITTGATLLAPSAFGQACDKCSGMSAPSCGCELPSCKHSGPKPCNCVRKPSVGELILGHFDRVGDQIEARAKKRGKGAKSCCESLQGPSCGCESAQGPTCGCEAPKSPSCGCEICSRTDNVQSIPVKLPPIQSALLHPNAGHTAPAAKGVLVDKESNVSPPPIGKQPIAKKQGLDTSVNSGEPSDPKVQRVPFEHRTPPSNSTNRIPAVETGPNTTPPSIPNVLKTIPTDIPPAWTPNALPPKAKSTTPTDSKLPDVLVDPFKDDLSSKGQNKSLIQLTSDRQIATNSLRSESTGHSEADQQVSLPIERPARLTPKQKQSQSTSQDSDTASLQFEASESASNAGATVVSSSYSHAVPAPVVVRKASAPINSDGAPSVSKVRVPTKR